METKNNETKVVDIYYANENQLAYTSARGLVSGVIDSEHFVDGYQKNDVFNGGIKLTILANTIEAWCSAKLKMALEFKDEDLDTKIEQVKRLETDVAELKKELLQLRMGYGEEFGNHIVNKKDIEQIKITCERFNYDYEFEEFDEMHSRFTGKPKTMLVPPAA